MSKGFYWISFGSFKELKMQSLANIQKGKYGQLGKQQVCLSWQTNRQSGDEREATKKFGAVAGAPEHVQWKEGLVHQTSLCEMIIQVIGVGSSWGWCFVMWGRVNLILMPTRFGLLKSAGDCHFAQFLFPSPRRWTLHFYFWKKHNQKKTPTPKPQTQSYARSLQESLNKS